jgi:hypothetical protein
MRVRDKVCLKSAPAVYGTVIAMQDGKAKVYWSSHTSQWIDSVALMRAPRVPRGDGK